MEHRGELPERDKATELGAVGGVRREKVVSPVLDLGLILSQLTTEQG